MYITKFRITNLTCDACVRVSTMILQDIPGVKKANINLGDGVSSVESDKSLDWQTIKSALEGVGKTAIPIS